MASIRGPSLRPLRPSATRHFIANLANGPPPAPGFNPVQRRYAAAKPVRTSEDGRIEGPLGRPGFARSLSAALRAAISSSGRIAKNWSKSVAVGDIPLFLASRDHIQNI